MIILKKAFCYNNKLKEKMRMFLLRPVIKVVFQKIVKVYIRSRG